MRMRPTAAVKGGSRHRLGLHLARIMTTLQHKSEMDMADLAG
jgi:hypothetical protein